MDTIHAKIQANPTLEGDHDDWALSKILAVGKVKSQIIVVATFQGGGFGALNRKDGLSAFNKANLLGDFSWPAFDFGFPMCLEDLLLCPRSEKLMKIFLANPVTSFEFFHAMSERDLGVSLNWIQRLIYVYYPPGSVAEWKSVQDETDSDTEPRPKSRKVMFADE